jgi:inosine-uridine nucleoside N-ribohydrolase
MRIFPLLTFVVLIPVFCACNQNKVNIIFDTDISPDYDDVGALAMLHAFADSGKVNLLATISCNTYGTTAATLDAINTYFGRPDIPIGVTRGSLPHQPCKQGWDTLIISNYPHTIFANEEAEDAVKLYRKILADQADGSVTIVSVGFFTNLAALLESKPDEWSELNGRDLVIKKVNKLVSMAAGLGKDEKGAYEFNVMIDVPAAQKVFGQWPTPFLISGFEIGEKIRTGIRLMHNASIQNSPVKAAFSLALKKDKNALGRNSWDQTAVLVAVKGPQPWFTTTPVQFEIQHDGRSVPVRGNKIDYLGFMRSTKNIGTEIENLMMHQP